jgi:branched-subunit amino acid aminotransferase/4-amino-4-deoxychorismate lyase
MIGDWIIHNGQLETAATSSLALDDNAIHGYGCYETLKMRSGVLYFPEFHEERLIGSARILGIDHDIWPGTITVALHRLTQANAIGDCNVKMLLIGRENRKADWYAFMIPALYPPAGAWDTGVDCLLFDGERPFPPAKSLGLLVSTIAFREARSHDCWDALLVNRRDEISEGTRTNLFYIPVGDHQAASDNTCGSLSATRPINVPDRGDAGFATDWLAGLPDMHPLVVHTPPAGDALEGITRRTLIHALSAAGIMVEERRLCRAEALAGSWALMVTSTSTRIAPVRRLVKADGTGLELPIPAAYRMIRAIYDRYLDEYAKGLVDS